MKHIISKNRYGENPNSYWIIECWDDKTNCLHRYKANITDLVGWK